MDKIDFRRYDLKTQEALCHQAVRLVIDESYSQLSAGVAVGVSRQTVSGWVRSYRKFGGLSLKDKRTNEHRQSSGILSAQEANKLQVWIKDKNPSQLKLPFALWTSKAIRDLIKYKFDKIVSLSTVHNYMKKWGYTPQKPLRRAYQRNPKKIQKWLDEHYPRIAKDAKNSGAVILWGDQTCVRNHDQIGRCYAPIGQTPVLQQEAKKFKTNMISAVSNRGDFHFMLYDQALNICLFIRFLKQLIRQFNGKKIVLIVDNLRVHHAKLVKKFIQHPWVNGRLELEYLPPYAPEYNPDEYLNNDLKQKLSQKPTPKNKQKLIDNTTQQLNQIGQNPGNVIAYFKHKNIKYAA